jgi:hypothetical protein
MGILAAIPYKGQYVIMMDYKDQRYYATTEGLVLEKDITTAHKLYSFPTMKKAGIAILHLSKEKKEPEKLWNPFTQKFMEGTN